MTSTNHERSDGKLLLAVVGVVVAGAVGIALLAGLSAQREAEQARVTGMTPAIGPSSPVTSRVAPTQASFTRTEEAIAPARPEIEPPIDEPIVVDPDANFVAVGLEAWDQREFDKAAAYFQAAADRQPGDAWICYMLGLSLWKDGRADEAAAAMRRSIEIDASVVKPLVNLSRIENDRGEFDAALIAADEALALEADHAEAQFLRGRSLYNLGRIEEALAALESSLSVDPENGYAHNLLGLIHIGHGTPQDAVDALERAAEREPDVAYIQNNLGMALELCGRDAEALVAYRRAVEIDSGHERARVNLARLEPLAGAPPADATSEEEEPPAALADLAEESEEPQSPADPTVQR